MKAWTWVKQSIVLGGDWKCGLTIWFMVDSYNELVHGDYNGFINQQTLVGGDWNHGMDHEVGEHKSKNYMVYDIYNYTAWW